MKKLFDDGPSQPPTIEVIRQLEGYGYKKETVAKWEAARANSILDSIKREEGIAIRRARDKAVAEGYKFDQKVPPPGLPVPAIRLESAAYIEQSTTADSRCQAVAYSICQLSNDELYRLAGYLVKLLRANDGHPAKPVEPAGETGGDRREPATEQQDAEARTGAA